MPRILLAGGGHTHLGAGPALARRVPPGTRIALVAPAPRLLYSGMMPGWLAGQYDFDACAIDLRRIATGAGIEWVQDTLSGIDFARREAIGTDGRRHPYDLLSLNVGSENQLGEIDPASSVRVLGAKPFAEFVEGWSRWLRAAPRDPRCVVVGGGAAAFEIACALAAGCRAGGPMAGGSVTVATTGDHLLPGMSALAVRLAERSLARLGIALRTRRRYLGAQGDSVRLAHEPRAGEGPRAAESMPADLVIVATGAVPPRWLADAARAGGLPVADDGGLAVDDCMRSPADARVFASGDCASFVHSRVPKSGVHALRQGGPLAESLARALGSAPAAGCAAPARYVAQRRALALLNRCDGTAIGAWGALGAAGRALWWWKDRIDRRFVDGFRDGDSAGGPV